MPGVPSGRGCDACRKQKKKCDQASPACSRCTRLGIPCAGAGKTRFKFINKTPEANTPEANTPGSTTPEKPCAAAPDPLSIVPSGPAALIAGNLVSKLRVTDARFNATCFGPFLRFVPGRIGVNSALDASVDAFCAAFSHLHTDGGSSRAFVKHGRALAALRNSLDSPLERRASETVCAIYLTMITESLIGATPGRHMEGLSYVLASQTQRKWTSQFELEMYTVMCFAVLMESLGNNRLNLGPWLPTLVDRIEPLHLAQAADNDPSNMDRYPSLDLRNLAYITELVRNPEGRLQDLQAKYHTFLHDKTRLLLIVKALEAPDASLASLGGRIEILRTVRMSQLTLAAGLALLVNRIMQAYDPLDMSLLSEGEALVHDIIFVGDKALPRRPLGAAHARPGLAVACAATHDPDRRQYIAELLQDIRGSSLHLDPMREVRWWTDKFDEVDARVAKYVSEQQAGKGGEEQKAVQPQCHVQ